MKLRIELGKQVYEGSGYYRFYIITVACMSLIPLAIYLEKISNRCRYHSKEQQKWGSGRHWEHQPWQLAELICVLTWLHSSAAMITWLHCSNCLHPSGSIIPGHSCVGIQGLPTNVLPQDLSTKTLNAYQVTQLQSRADSKTVWTLVHKALILLCWQIIHYCIIIVKSCHSDHASSQQETPWTRSQSSYITQAWHLYIHRASKLC